VALSARDTKAVLALLEHAQLVYLLTRYPKKQVLDDEGDVTKLEQGLDAMREEARRISNAVRERTTEVPWDLVLKKTDGPELSWRVAKRVTPRVLAYLVPLVEGQPAAAFFLRPEKEKPKKATVRKATRRPDRASRRPGRAGKRT
jgi:hypothetical protein